MWSGKVTATQGTTCRGRNRSLALAADGTGVAEARTCMGRKRSLALAAGGAGMAESSRAFAAAQA